MAFPPILARPIPPDFRFSEEASTARLVEFYQTARLEILEFLERGNPTPADRKFYRAFLDQVDEVLAVVEVGAASWVDDTIASAYSAGIETAGMTAGQVINSAAIDSLADYTMGLIRSTSDGVRRGIGQAIASGILEGLTGQDLRDRIRATGLQAGPWSSVEQRAGVIARTETMRAYNSGNLAGIEAAEGHAVQWITAHDERLCPICAEKSGKVYYLDEEGAAMFPNASVFEGAPAHPRCRCTIRGVFGPEDVEDLEPGAGETAVPAPPPAKPKGATLEDLMEDLENPGLYDATKAKVRDLPPLSEADLVRLSQARDGQCAAFVELRYGAKMKTASADGHEWRQWFDHSRHDVLESLERIRRVAPELVVDSRYFKSLQLGGQSYGAAADASAYGQIRISITSLSNLNTKGRPIFAGNSWSTEVMTHELGHEISNYFGMRLPAKYGQPAPRPEYDALWDRWRLQHRRNRNQGGVYGEGNTAQLEYNVRVLEHQLVNARDMVEHGWIDPRGVKRIETKLAKAKAQLEAIASGGTVGEQYPSNYAKTDWGEDWAESFAAYVLAPGRLKESSPTRYAIINELLGGRTWD